MYVFSVSRVHSDAERAARENERRMLRREGIVSRLEVLSVMKIGIGTFGFGSMFQLWTFIYTPFSDHIGAPIEF